jgi:hypothetical protein
MKEILTKINIEKGYDYKVDKYGNVYKTKYNLLKDPYTLVTICLIILALSYYFQIKDSEAHIKNLDNTCEVYLQFKERWMLENPGEIIDTKKILDTALKNKWQINS